MSSSYSHDSLKGFKFSERKNCRVCAKGELESLWNLGDLHLTGLFPGDGEIVPIAPLHVGQCTNCTAVQLIHDYSTATFFGEGYGYRSGLNKSMVSHLEQMVTEVEGTTCIEDGDIVVDIGGNDGTALSKYQSKCKKILIDPTASNWKDYIDRDIEVVSDFFRGSSQIGGGSAKLVTSVSMLYDLDSPCSFLQNVWDILKPGGFWLTEQSDLTLMLEQNSFDTICHEHLEYYSREVLLRMANQMGFQLVSESANFANGGSKRYLFLKPSKAKPIAEAIEATSLKKRLESQRQAFGKLTKYTTGLRESTLSLANKSGVTIHGLGASTKGNTILQILGLSSNEIKVIAEVNPKKFGKFTPGTLIPIVSEKASLEDGPSHYLILPWHFRSNFMSNWSKYGKSLAVFPIPSFEILLGK